MKRSIFILVLGCTSITSCSPKFYVPTTQNVPLISEKKEVDLTFSGNTNRVEFHGAYGVSDRFALKADGGLFIPKNLSNGNGGSGKYAEAGLGYYELLSENLVFETYAILGVGGMENHLPSTVNDYPQTTGNISSNIMVYGIQPNFGFKSSFFSAAISSRIVNLTYNGVKGDLIYNNEDEISYLKHHNSNLLVEPALTIKAGFKKIKLQIQYGYSINTSNSNFKQDNSFLTAGLNFNF